MTIQHQIPNVMPTAVAPNVYQQNTSEANIFNQSQSQSHNTMMNSQQQQQQQQSLPASQPTQGMSAPPITMLVYEELD